METEFEEMLSFPINEGEKATVLVYNHPRFGANVALEEPHVMQTSTVLFADRDETGAVVAFQTRNTSYVRRERRVERGESIW